MVDFNLATGPSQPINRTGIENCQVSGSDVQATPVGIDNSGADPQLVKADADSATAIHAVGVLFPEEVFDESTLPTGSHFQDLEEQLIHEFRTLKGDRVTVVFTGVELVNDDDDTTYTPSEPVYLAPGGGFTQTKPSSTGDIIQVLGVALTPDDNGDGKDRILLDVDWDYSTSA
jgi:hypothetical protein